MALALPPLAAGRAGQGPATSLVVGQVIDADTSRPVGGAVVTLTIGSPQPGVPPQPGSRRGTAIADAQGRFLFRDVAGGEYTITATLNGYAPGATGRRRPNGPTRPIAVGDGERITDVVVSMWRLTSISGQVIDDLGEPVVAVPVWVLRKETAGGRERLTLGSVELTDDRGRYRVSSLVPGPYAVAIRSTTRTAALSSVHAYNAAVASGSAAPIMSQWRESGALSPSGAGLVIGDWQIQDMPGTPPPVPGPDGRLFVHPTTLYPSVAHAADATIIALRSGDERQGVDVSLPLVPTVRVSGFVMGPDGSAANMAVRLLPRDRDGPALAAGAEIAIATTDEGGRFALLGVPAGEYTLRAHRVPRTTPMRMPMPPQPGGPPGRTVVETLPATPQDAQALFAEMPLAVGGADVDDLALMLQPGARLSGRVEFEGAASRPAPAQLQAVSVSLTPIGGSIPAIDQARVDAEGRFTTLGYPPGRYLLDATDPPGGWTLQSIQIAGDDVLAQPFALEHRDVGDIVLTFTDRITELSGTVQAAGRGPDLDANVVAFPADYDGWMAGGMSARRVATAPASSTGVYQMRLAMPGDYLVIALPPDVAPDVDAAFVAAHAPQAVRVSIRAGERKVQALTMGTGR